MNPKIISQFPDKVQFVCTDEKIIVEPDFLPIAGKNYLKKNINYSTKIVEQGFTKLFN